LTLNQSQNLNLSQILLQNLSLNHFLNLNLPLSNLIHQW
jgi:hypothetical protein